MTKGWSGDVLDIGVASKEDTDKVVEIVTAVAEALRAAPRFAAAILSFTFYAGAIFCVVALAGSRSNRVRRTNRESEWCKMGRREDDAMSNRTRTPRTRRYQSSSPRPSAMPGRAAPAPLP
jgi:small-conductance mechanosensitive channel